MPKSDLSPLAYTLRGIDPQLWVQVKMKAASERLTVRAVIEQLLRAWVAASLLLIAFPASAQSLRIPASIYLAGSALDTGTTLDGFRTGRCYESTNGMQWGTEHPKAFAAFSVGAAIGAVYLWHWIGKEYPKLAWMGLIGMGTARGWQGWQNYQLCR